ncbi:hypothetical protein E5288_WYG001324 [Bos mutus]|uniref:CSD domain-containing protein n=1 Tax=Bos mutus TaxID=72004 RepID=A0A6B0R793_9CETA|nr:hypothetical protein [Bos mutus]
MVPQPLLLVLRRTEALFQLYRSHSLLLLENNNGGAGKGGGEEPGKLPEQAEDESQVLHGTGHCKWFNVRMGFGFISMISREGSPLDIPVDVFVHQRNCRSVASGVTGYYVTWFVSGK